jgi:transcriptional regulator with GAF, ATPase, and Fis domain
MGGDTTLPRERRKPGASKPARATLRAVHPPGLDWSLELGPARIEIGRGAEPPLDHPTVSRRHCAVEWSGDYSASDMESRNGSFLDGAELSRQPAALRDQSLLRLGDVLLIFESALAARDASEVSLEKLPGESASMRALRGSIAAAARDPSPALIVGETGCGKEWVAGELHRLSGRRGKLVPVNCAALSAQLVESQLFGHLRGAFTGATDAQPGLFRAAHRGTLFLDEIGDLPLDQQPKLLRALEQSEVVPVGAVEPVSVDVRAVAATHRDLASAVESGAFRRDLHARLSLWELRVPSLRERRVDLFAWIARFADGRRKRAPEFSADAAEALLLARWPGNLRDLQRLAIELSTVESGPIERERLPPWISSHTEQPASARPAAPTREEFVAVFHELSGSVHGLARRFARDRRQIYRWIASYGLKASE